MNNNAIPPPPLARLSGNPGLVHTAPGYSNMTDGLMAETKTLNEFRDKFRVEELLIYANQYWSWSVRPAQPTLGAGVISLNRYALTLGEVTADEMASLAEVIGEVETRIKRHFNHNIMNYLALMMVDRHVHYHVIPRYEGVRKLSGVEWVDNGWPALPVITDAQHGDNKGLLDDIRKTLGAN